MADESQAESCNLLDAIIFEWLEHDKISGRRLRAAFKETFTQRIQEVASVSPSLIRVVGENPEEFYFPTINGLLASTLRDDVSVIVDALLDFLRKRSENNPDFTSYTWDEIRQFNPKLEKHGKLVLKVISVTGLMNGGGGSMDSANLSYQCNTPRDIEKIVACAGAEEFAKYVRLRDENTTSRPQPVLPIHDEDDTVEGPADSGCDFDLLNLHWSVVASSRDHFLAGKFRNAVLDAAISLSAAVKLKSSVSDVDGHKLMARVLDENRPILAVNDLETEFQMSEQIGWKLLFMGVVQAIRNPSAHSLEVMNKQDSLEMLCFLSLLHRKLEKMTLKIKPTTRTS